MKSVPLAICLLSAAPALAQPPANGILDAGGVGSQIIDPTTGAVDGTVTITNGNPLTAKLSITVGSACEPGICNLSEIYVGFTMAGFPDLPGKPACVFQLLDGAYHQVTPTLSRADPWPVGTTVTSDFDVGSWDNYTYYVRVFGPPKSALDNPGANSPAKVFVPGQQLRISVICARLA